MEHFEREVARRADAAAEAYRRACERRDRTRQRARELLAEIRRRFVQAARCSGNCLGVRYLDRVGADRAVGYALVWNECPPRRQLCLRLDEAHGVVRWELASPGLRRSRMGSVAVLDFRTEFLDRLIYALLEQESWRRSRVPPVEPASAQARG
jgi:hypothetical protein